jgi:hypothetical protein
MRQETKWVMWGILAFGVIWDVIAAAQKNESTFTAELRKTAKQTAMLPFIAGLLMGHLWWT